MKGFVRIPGALVVAVVGFLALSALRPGLAQRFHKLKATSDVYALPAPEQVVVLSLGYRAALADLISGNLLVSYGLHFQEKRRFEFMGNYLDTINELDPKYDRPYLFADTLLTIQPTPATIEDYYKAREIYRRGMRELPHAAELWHVAGQFLAYVAVAAFPDEETRKEWRLEGAQAMAHACEITDSSSNIPYHCITAAGILNRAGKREAVIQMLSRTLAVNDNEDIRELALAYLDKAVSARAHEKQQRRIAAFEKVWKSDLGYVDKDAMLVLGPRVNTVSCAGVAAAHNKACVTTWRAWSEQQVEPSSVDEL